MTEIVETVALAGYNRARGPAALRTLRELRLERGLSLRALEELTGVNRGILSQLERGRLIPAGDVLERLADVLEVRLEWRPMVVEA
jgi:transcriptional regulator with XRE-family HTH domain